MITIFAPDGIGEVTVGTDLAELVLTAIAADPLGPLRERDIVVVTSKIVSKAEGRTFPADQREQLISDETADTVVRRGPMRIVRTARGLVQAAAGVDSSNVDAAHVLALPVDADASAAALRAGLLERAGLHAVGVVISDTAGRAWRIGQTDHAIGAAGVQVLADYAGRTDAYGQELQVTMTALADELSAAADLAKGKLAARPVAVIRGLGELVVGSEGARPNAAKLVRPLAEDFFALGTEEAVLATLLSALGQRDRFEELVAMPRAGAAELVAAGRSSAEANLIRRLLVPSETAAGSGSAG